MFQQAFGEEVTSQTQCFEWYSHFKTWRTLIDEDPRSGRPSMSTDDVHIEAVHDLILQNCWFTIREIAEDVGITVRRKRPQLWTNQSWVLHHDNAPAHSSFLVHNFLAKNETTVLLQPPYSPDLASADFFCFLSWSLPWKDAVSTHLTRSRNIRQSSCSPFWKQHSRKRSKVGRNVGSGVLLAKETTLKAINLNTLYLST
jgi:hypothetical protein